MTLSRHWLREIMIPKEVIKSEPLKLVNWRLLEILRKLASQTSTSWHARFVYRIHLFNSRKKSLQKAHLRSNIILQLVNISYGPIDCWNFERAPDLMGYVCGWESTLSIVEVALEESITVDKKRDSLRTIRELSASLRTFHLIRSRRFK